MKTNNINMNSNMNNMIIIKNGSENDIINLMKMDIECFAENRYDKKFWKYLLKQFNLLVSYDTSSEFNKLIGYISLIKTKIKTNKLFSFAINQTITKYKLNDCYLIASICVAKNYRSTGIGGELLERAIENITSGSCIMLNVRISNKNAINFYLKHKFVISEFVDEDYYDNPKEDGYVMYKIL